MAGDTSPDLLQQPTEDLSVRQLYLQLAGARAATIQHVLWQTTDTPEPLAETLTLAAAGLAHVAGATCAGLGEMARSAAVARRLTAEAHRHDVRAGAFAERALSELEHAPLDSLGLIHEAAESLVWACAVLRHHGSLLEDAEDGNADQLELAWMSLIEAAELLMAADRAAIEVREAAG